MAPPTKQKYHENDTTTSLTSTTELAQSIDKPLKHGRQTLARGPDLVCSVTIFGPGGQY